MISLSASDIERFWSFVGSEDQNGCRPWTGNVSRGLPRFSVKGRVLAARRIAYDLTHDDPLADEATARTTCRNALCIAAPHLFARLKGNDMGDGTKRCSRCQEIKPVSDFSMLKTGSAGRYNYCRLCQSARKKAEYHADPRKALKWRLRSFGLTLEQYDAMVAEHGGKCAICGGPGGFYGLGVDHDHDTGQVRGLLCSNDNAGIAMFKHDAERMRKAIAYLEKWAPITESGGAGATSVRSRAG